MSSRPPSVAKARENARTADGRRKFQSFEKVGGNVRGGHKKLEAVTQPGNGWMGTACSLEPPKLQPMLRIVEKHGAAKHCHTYHTRE